MRHHKDSTLTIDQTVAHGNSGQTLMMKLFLGIATVMTLLTACAGRHASDATTESAATPSSSNVELYGTIDMGIGTHRISR
jgi:hypothetical protein